MHRNLSSLVVLAVITCFAAPALCQDETPLAPPPASPAATQACSLGAHPGVTDEDANAATSMVCDELRSHGARGNYHVGLTRLGSSVFLSASSDNGDTRRLQLASVEEVSVAAPRLAEALVQGKSTEQTQQVDNLVGEETRNYQKKRGEFLVGLGLAGIHVAGSDLAAAPAFNLRIGYETPSFGVGTDLRAGGGSTDNSSLAYFSWGLGAKYFLLRGDISPFFGAGLAYSAMSVGDGSGNGLGAYAEIGVEALRLHKSRFTVDLRLDTPFYRVSSNDSYTNDGAFTPSRKTYDLPVGFALAYSF